MSCPTEEASGRDPTPIGERVLADLAAFHALPSGAFEACDMRPGRVSSTSLVRYRNVDYSVPTAHAYTTVLVKGFVDEVSRRCSSRSCNPRTSW